MVSYSGTLRKYQKKQDVVVQLRRGVNIIAPNLDAKFLNRSINNVQLDDDIPNELQDGTVGEVGRIVIDKINTFDKIR